MESYYRRTVSLPIKPSADLDHPNEVKTRLFISVIKQNKTRFTELKSNTIAKRIKSILAKGGVDVSKFQSHVLRHVSLNHQIAAGKDIDDVLARACVSSKVFSMFYKLPVKASTASAPEHIMFSADQENEAPASMTLVTKQTATTTSTSSTVSSRSALRIQAGPGRARKKRRTSASTGVT